MTEVLGDELVWVVSGPGIAAPARRPASVRRTATLDMRWPDGWGARTQVLGRARDLITPAASTPAQVSAEDILHVDLSPDRTIEAISSGSGEPDLQGLVGARAGSGLRAAIIAIAAAERAAGSPLYLLLDDLAGASLVAGYAQSQWPAESDRQAAAMEAHRRRRRPTEGICIGFRPGASALIPGRELGSLENSRVVAPFTTDDELGWHLLTDYAEMSMRRARRIDIHLEGDNGEIIVIDSMFQDSARRPDGTRAAVHEYGLTATADRASGRLLTVAADPRVLPYAECPFAAGNVDRLVGTPLAQLRSVVLEQLKGVHGCTHLNDALRALAEAPVLVDALIAATSTAQSAVDRR